MLIVNRNIGTMKSDELEKNGEKKARAHQIVMPLKESRKRRFEKQNIKSTFNT